MRQISLISCLTTLTVLMGGCSLFGGGGENIASSQPTPTSSAAATQSPTSKPFSGKPLVEGAQDNKGTPNSTEDKPSIAGLTPPELIAPTDPDRRRAELQKNNQSAKDPFGVLPIPPNPEEANTANTPTQLPDRAVPGQPGIPIPQPPKLTATATSNRSVPESPEVPLAQPPRLRFPVSTNKTLPKLQITPGSIPKSPTFQPPKSSPKAAPFTGGLGRVSQGPTSARNTVARQPQRTVQTSRLVSRQTQRPASTLTRTTVARVVPRPQTNNRTTVARVVPRPQTNNRMTVARVVPQPQTNSRTTVARVVPRSQIVAPTTALPRRPSNLTIAQAAPATSTPPAVNTPAATPTVPVPAAPPQIPSLPAPPDPALARAVEISGVIVVGNEPQAIVKAPNEATTRYVKVGQRLSNGQVLVKRIEMGEGSEPIVILEQNGVEVSKGVGETPPTPAQPGQAAPTTPAATPQATV